MRFESLKKYNFIVWFIYANFLAFFILLFFSILNEVKTVNWIGNLETGAVYGFLTALIFIKKPVFKLVTDNEGLGIDALLMKSNYIAWDKIKGYNLTSFGKVKILEFTLSNGTGKKIPLIFNDSKMFLEKLDKQLVDRI